jgi:hypothetical protein
LVSDQALLILLGCPHFKRIVGAVGSGMKVHKKMEVERGFSLDLRGIGVGTGVKRRPAGPRKQ